MKTNTTTRKREVITIEEEVLYVALELGKARWKVASTPGAGQKPREVWIKGGDGEGLRHEIERAKQRFGLSSPAAVRSCYEAGQEGFWLHRYLVAAGVRNVVVDSSSIEVKRRARRAKSDHLDVGKLLKMLLRYSWGEREVWSVVKVPTVEQEDARQLHRELWTLKQERTRVLNRMRGLVAAHGVTLKGRGKGFLRWLEEVGLWDGSGLALGVRRRLEREYARLELIGEQIRGIEKERREAMEDLGDERVKKVRSLMGFRALGMETAWLYTMEFFSWRGFRNRREVGALAGLVPTPYQSGGMSHDQGVSKAGNRYVRALAVEAAWRWLRWQPRSQLSLWYRERFGAGSKRLRKIGIVALARKLLVALWRYVEKGVLPQGAQLKPIG